ncbi:MAG: amidohydrolase [Hyphomicrobiales bacterium]|nr:MAG: amidohydrolase [Hyphomicrobiales bacterium]
MRIVDTHLHLIYPEAFTYEWLKGEPALNRQWTVESYWAEVEGNDLGIEAAIHMEVDVAEPEMVTESEFALNLHPQVVAAIANGRPDRKDFPAYLGKLDALGGVRGVRRLLQGQPPELAEQPLFIENLKRLPAHRMTFDICLKSHELTVAEKLIPAAPEVQFVLDHCGNPKIGDGEWDSWVRHIDAIAAYPNVVCKVSGILANVKGNWTVDQVRPYVEHVIDRFGWDRVVWGSDHPVVTLFADLTRWVHATREIIAGCSAEEQAKLLHRNAERIYRLV